MHAKFNIVSVALLEHCTCSHCVAAQDACEVVSDQASELSTQTQNIAGSN